MLSGEVGAVGATLTSPGVALLEVDLVVAAVLGPDLEHALDVHLGDVLLLEAVLDLEEFVEERVVERLGAQQADVELERLADLADLAVPHHRRHRGLAAHADEGEPFEALLLGLVEGHRVRRVRVATAGAAKDLVAVGGDHRERLPARFAVLERLDAGGEGTVDDVVLEEPDQHGGDEAAVLAGLVDEVVARPGEEDVGVDARHLAGLTLAAVEVHVGLGLPHAEAGAGTGARGTTLLAVDAVGLAELFLEVERLVGAGLVLIADDVVGAADHTARAPGAQSTRDDLVVEFLPLVGPTFLLGGGSALGHGHGSNLAARWGRAEIEVSRWWRPPARGRRRRPSRSRRRSRSGLGRSRRTRTARSSGRGGCSAGCCG